jgi:transposase InsO family protein
MPPKGLANALLNAIKVDPDSKNVALQNAPKIKQQEKGKFRVLKRFGLLQADLIYMPEDKGFKYILTVVDVASRIIDAIPLKGRESQDVVEGFEQIKKHKHIDMDKVTSIYTDPGSEFKNKDVHDYFEKQEIVIRHGMTNRHQQQGVVEYYNHLLTKALGTKMTSQTLDANEHISTWVDDLPKLVAVLNRKENLHENTDISKFFSLPTAPADKDILKEGTVVHVRLQQPKNPLTGERLHGTFRNSDLRYERDQTEISRVLLLPGQKNIRYMVKKYKQTNTAKLTQ